MTDLEFTSQTKRLLSDYMNANSKRTISSTAKKASLSTSSLDRILKGEQIASLETMLAIAQVIDDKDSWFDIIRLRWPQYVTTLTTIFQTTKAEVSQDSVSTLIRDLDNFVIISLAATDEGTTREEISVKLPEVGLAKLEILLNEGVVKEINSRLKASPFAITSAETLLIQFANLTRLFDKSQIGEVVTKLALHTEGYSETGLQNLGNLVWKFNEDVANLNSDPKNRGNNVAYIGLIADTIRKGKKL